MNASPRANKARQQRIAADIRATQQMLRDIEVLLNAMDPETDIHATGYGKTVGGCAQTLKECRDRMVKYNGWSGWVPEHHARHIAKLKDEVWKFRAAVRHEVREWCRERGHDEPKRISPELPTYEGYPVGCACGEDHRTIESAASCRKCQQYLADEPNLPIYFWSE